LFIRQRPPFGADGMGTFRLIPFAECARPFTFVDSENQCFPSDACLVYT
jgi:hypothetical protein